jgi:CBS domain-containing protein
MTAPAVTVRPGAAIQAAVRIVNTHRVRRLPVTGPGGELVGIVSRRDLLSVFLRPIPTSSTMSGKPSTSSHSPIPGTSSSRCAMAWWPSPERCRPSPARTWPWSRSRSG